MMLSLSFDAEDITEEMVKAGSLVVTGSVGTHSTSNDMRGPFRWKVPAAYDSRLYVVGFARNFFSVQLLKISRPVLFD
jgi:hypothetical protein